MYYDDPLMTNYFGDNDYIVFEKDVVRKALTGPEKKILSTYFNKVTANKEYLVVDKDCFYAQDVEQIIKENSKKEIICFIGRAGSGKDYQCKLLQDKGYTKVAFADALREILRKTLHINSDYFYDNYDSLKGTEMLQLPTIYNGETVTYGVTLRQMLEALGSSVRSYDENFWVTQALKQIQDKKLRKVCISDMRYLNEYVCIKDFALENDYDLKVIFCNFRSKRYQDRNHHESAAMSNYFATHGYQDLQELTPNNFLSYEEYINHGE